MSRIDKTDIFHKIKFASKNLFKRSIFEALITLWTAPIDSPRLDLSKVKKSSKITNTWFFNSLIVGYKK